jgi:hypothetical protein
MNLRSFTTVVAIVGLAGMLTAFLHVAQVKADHCHPTHTKAPQTPSEPSTPSNKPVSTSESNLGRQHNNSRVLSINKKPFNADISSSKIGLAGSDTLSLEEIYSKDFPIAISSINNAVKAIQSGDRSTELAELSKALDKLTMVYKALGTHVKPQFANSLICPIMGSPIDVSKVNENLMRSFKGRKIAFCCNGCPSAWDKLSNAEKQAKVPGLKS